MVDARPQHVFHLGQYAADSRFAGCNTDETSWLIAAYIAPYAGLTILLVKIRTQFGLLAPGMSVVVWVDTAAN